MGYLFIVYQVIGIDKERELNEFIILNFEFLMQPFSERCEVLYRGVHNILKKIKLKLHTLLKLIFHLQQENPLIVFK